MVPFEMLYSEVFDVLEMKCQDLHNQGIKNVSEEQLWRYFLEKKWHDLDKEELHMYEIVSDIFALSTAQYMAFAQSKRLEKKAQLASINEKERNSLLGTDEF